MTDLNLRQAVREALLTADSVEYADVAGLILASLKRDQYAAALSQTLPAFVRSVVVTQRTNSVSPPNAETQPGSWKVKGIRAWAHRLSDVYATESGNKRLADFTFDDLQFLAETCRDLAERNAASAARWERLAEAVKDAGADRVADVPEDVLADVLGAVA